VELEHPIPQQISSFQFKLVGDMTLKQFFQVAAGSLLALLLYSSSLPSYVKWPLIIICFLAGVAFAFFPLQNRPLSTWILLFIKSIYSPTIYTWRKSDKKPAYFSAEPILNVAPVTLPSATQELPVPIQPLVTPDEDAVNPPEFTKLEKKEKEILTSISQHFAKDVSPAPVFPESQQSPKKVEVPNIQPLEVANEEKIQDLPPVELFVAPSSLTSSIVNPMAGTKSDNLQSATFSPESAPPTPPTKANIIVGQVVDPDGKIVENAILEIKDTEGRPARALKSNKLGHFMIVTPLADGRYEILTEKEGLIFEPVSIEAKGEIIPPIAIWAKKSS